MRKTMNKVIGGILLAAVMSGCSSNDNNGPAKLSIAVTDSPVDNATAVVVTFTGVELLDSGGGVSQSFTFDAPKSIDLLQMQGAQSEFLIEGEVVPVGVYDQVRLIIDTPNASCNNLTGTPASYIQFGGPNSPKDPLVVPSGGASGLKVMGPITVAQGGTASYTIDFDLRKSIAERGATGCYNLRPVLRVVDNAQVGTLSGTVAPTLLQQDGCTADPATGDGAAVYVYSGSGVVPDDVDGTDPEPLTSAQLTLQDDGSFSYEIGFLLAGEYTAAFTCQAGDDTAGGNEAIVFTGAANVSIAADTTTTQDFSLTAAPTPTPTPAPTESPEPTATPAPTESPAPTPTPTP